MFVFTSATPPAAAARGNLVSVTGTVTEYAPASDPYSPTLTELIEPSVSVVSIGHPLPAAATLTMANLSPSGGIEQLERFEGMRVHVASLTVVGPAGDNGVYYGVLPGVPRPFREPGVRLPDPLPEGAPPYIPRFDANPERLRVDSGAAAVWVATGATVTDLAGPLDYGFRSYTILPDPVGPAFVPATLDRRGRLSHEDEITVASLNLQRLQHPAKAALAIRTALNLPDILAVQEVENLAALEALAGRLGSNYQAYLVEGNDPSGIDVGFLIKTTRVKVLDVRQEGKGAVLGREPLFDRPPLVLRATASSLPLTVIANHLRSLIGLEAPGNQAVIAKRKAQAEYLAGLIQARQAENLVVLGDFNAFEFNDGYVDVLGTLRGRPARPEQVLAATADLVNPDLITLIDLLPRRERYSYVEDGDAAALDHILVNRALAPRVTYFAYARGNADSPEFWRNDPFRPERVSDHDAPVAYLSLAATPPAIFPAGVTSAASLEPGPLTPGAIVRILGTGLGPSAPATLALSPDGQFVTNSLAGTRVLFDGIAAPLVYVSAGQVNAVAPYALAGKSTTELAVESSGRLTNKITLAVERGAPALFTAGASGCGQGAILNENNTVNGAANPAPRGSVVILYGAGGGQTEPSLPDGRVIGRELPRLTLPVAVRIGGHEAEVLYAGSAPGLVNGVLQVNARVPAAVVPGSAVPVDLIVGESASQPCVVVALR